MLTLQIDKTILKNYKGIQKYSLYSWPQVASKHCTAAYLPLSHTQQHERENRKNKWEKNPGLR